MVKEFLKKVATAVDETVDGIAQNPQAFVADVKDSAKETALKGVKAVRETAQGIEQDPDEFGRNVIGNATDMVEKTTKTVKDAGKRVADATNRAVDEHIVQPIDKAVVKPVKKGMATLRETVQGISQDPKAFGHDVVDSAVAMVDKATAPVRSAGRKVAGLAQQGVASVKGTLGKATQRVGEEYDQVQAVLLRLGRDVKGFAELPKDQQKIIAEGFLKDLQKTGKDTIDVSKGFVADKVAGVKGALRKAVQPIQKATQKASNAVEVTMKGLERDIDGFKNLTPDQKRQIAEIFIREAGENAVKLWDKAKNYAIIGAAKIAGKGK